MICNFHVVWLDLMDCGMIYHAKMAALISNLAVIHELQSLVCLGSAMYFYQVQPLFNAELADGSANANLF